MSPSVRSYCWQSLAFLIFFSSISFGQTSPSSPELIQRFDQDKDGKLDEQELDSALKSLEEKPTTRKFVRVTKNKKGQPLSLETAVVSFEHANGTRVDLIGAVHVADKQYYKKLNDLFTQYDLVLYELVAPEGTRVPRGGQRSRHPVGRMQEGIKTLLDLSFQLNHIDYTAKNLVHADMSPDEFAQRMKDRGESFLQILFRMMGQAAAQAGKSDGPSDSDLLFALFAPDRAMRLKRVMASQFEDIEGQMKIFEGPDGSTLISERNKRALEVLSRELKNGHEKIAIFYGAGHMPDFSGRLQQELGYTYSGTEWIQAWDMSAGISNN